MPRSDAGSVAAIYIQAWTSGDFDLARSTLHDDVSFVGPLGVANGVEECLGGLHGLKEIVDSGEVRKVVASGDDACVIYDLITNTAAGTIPTAGWFRLRDDKIVAIQVFFDARPFEASR